MNYHAAIIAVGGNQLTWLDLRALLEHDRRMLGTIGTVSAMMAMCRVNAAQSFNLHMLAALHFNQVIN